MFKCNKESAYSSLSPLLLAFCEVVARIAATLSPERMIELSNYSKSKNKLVEEFAFDKLLCMGSKQCCANHYIFVYRCYRDFAFNLNTIVIIIILKFQIFFFFFHFDLKSSLSFPYGKASLKNWLRLFSSQYSYLFAM